MLDTTAPLFKNSSSPELSNIFGFEASATVPDWKQAFDVVMTGDMQTSPQFQPVREALYYNGDALEPALIMLAKIALRKDSDNDVFKIGSRVLEHFLQDGNTAITLGGGFWDDVRLRMKERSEMPAKGHAVKASAKAFSANDDKASNSFGFGPVFRR